MEARPFFSRDEESLLAFHPSQIILLDQRRHQKPCHSEEPGDEESLFAFVDARFFGLTKSRRFSHRRLLISAPRQNLRAVIPRSRATRNPSFAFVDARFLA